MVNASLRLIEKENPEVQIEDILKKYENIKVISSGGQGKIAKAVSKLTGKEVILKIYHDVSDVINPTKQDFEIAKEGAEKEIAFLEKVQGRKDVPQIIESGVTGLFQENVLVMEKIIGKNLEEIMQESFFNPNLEEGLRLAKSLIEILYFTHEKTGLEPFLHRDVKPANIMLDENNNYILLDWSTGKIGSGKTAWNTAFYSYYYTAPEVMMGKSVTKATDIYGLGKVLQHYFLGKKFIENEGKITMKDLNFLPKNIAKALMKATEHDPNKRYQSIDELKQVLEHTELSWWQRIKQYFCRKDPKIIKKESCQKKLNPSLKDSSVQGSKHKNLIEELEGLRESYSQIEDKPIQILKNKTIESRFISFLDLELERDNRDIYTFYLEKFQQVKLELDKINPCSLIDEAQKFKEKYVEKCVFYKKEYDDSDEEILEEYRKFGFKSAPLSNLKYVKVKDPKIVNAPNGWWAIKEGVMRIDGNNIFPIILIFKQNSERLLEERVRADKLFGIYRKDIQKYNDYISQDRRDDKNIEGFFIYEIGEVQIETITVKKSEREIFKEGCEILYIEKFGNNFNKSIENLLKLRYPSYQAKIYTKVDLPFEISNRVIDIYRAACDSQLFDKIEFVVCEKKNTQSFCMMYGELKEGYVIPIHKWT